MMPVSPGSGRFPSTARLLTPRDFHRVQTGGRSIDLGPLVFRLAPRPAAPQPDSGGAESSVPEARLGLAISRKVGNAVMRNRVKRRVRECFRIRRGSFSGFDLVVTGRPAAATLETAEVAALFEKLLQRLGRG